MPWYAMGLSIMATQASAITFISTTGQGFADGMRFVQFYFGLPIAMVILSATAVPIFHRAKVYTAYEYLEQRFDAQHARARHRDLSWSGAAWAQGCALAAPAIVMSAVLGIAVSLDDGDHGRPHHSLTQPRAESKRSHGRTCCRWA